MPKAIIAFVVSLALLFPGFQEPSGANAAGCSVSGGQSGRLKHSGQVTSLQAKVCGKEIWRLIGKPKKPATPAKPIVQNKQPKPIRWKNEFSVIPDRPKIISDKTINISPNEEIQLTSSAVRHVRNRMLLWYPSQVSFKPVRANWTFSDGEKEQGNSITRSWGATGSYRAQLAVDYSVRYRILGRTGWIVLPGNVTSRSAPIDLVVSQGSAQEGEKVVLVHWNCFQKPLSPSC
jgi:hypothetical protein